MNAPWQEHPKAAWPRVTRKFTDTCGSRWTAERTAVVETEPSCGKHYWMVGCHDEQGWTVYLRGEAKTVAAAKAAATKAAK